MTKQVRIEYGDSFMDIEVPESALVVRTGETFSEPEPLEDPVEATRRALAEPLGSPPRTGSRGASTPPLIGEPQYPCS